MDRSIFQKEKKPSVLKTIPYRNVRRFAYDCDALIAVCQLPITGDSLPVRGRMRVSPERRELGGLAEAQADHWAGHRGQADLGDLAGGAADKLLLVEGP